MPASVMTLEEAIERVGRMIGLALDWTCLESFLPETEDLQLRRSALASSFLAALELARRGRLEIAQDEAFAPIRLKGCLMDELARAIEATLFASAEPMTSRRSRSMSGRARSARAGRLAAHYEGHGIELVERGGRWHFQTAPDLAHLLRRTREEPRRLSRAATETLAIIAYHEPVSRAEIEAIRGVQISKGTLDVLMDAGWVRPAGRREGPGRPLLYATTEEFLTHFGLGSRRDLPGIDDLKAAGLLDPLDEVRRSSFNWKATSKATRYRRKGVRHGRSQHLAYPDLRGHRPAAVRREPLLGDDGRRRQGLEKLQAGHGRRG